MADTKQNVEVHWSVSGLAENTRLTYTYNNALTMVKGSYGTAAKAGFVYRDKLRQVTEQTKKGSMAAGLFNKQMAGLALRFVGYQFILSQVMGWQQKLIDFIHASIEKYREFNKSIAEVSTILTRENLPAIYSITAGVEVLSKQYGKSATDLAKGTYDILSAAFDSTDAIRLLNISTKAAIAGLAEVSTSVDIFTSVLNAYGMTVGQAQEVSDIFFQTIRYGKLVFDDLASALGYITPIAAAAGVPFREIAAALSTVTRMGLHVDMASRGLALAIQNVMSPTKQAAEAARQYGVDMSDLALKVKGLEGFILDLNAAMNEHGSTILPRMIRNMRSLRVVMALTSEEGVAGFTRDLNLMARAAGATEVAMTKMLRAAQTEADIAEQSMEYLQRRIGDVWHEIDIWWKKATVWWGAFFAGADADKAVREVEQRLDNIRTAYINMFKTTSDIAAKKPLADIVVEQTVDFSRQIDFDSIRQYLDYEQKIRDLAIEQEDTNVRLLEQKDLKRKLFERAKTAKTNEAWEALREAAKKLDELNEKFTAGNIAMENYQMQQMALQPHFDYLSNGLDTLSQNITTYKENIMLLENAIGDLQMEVSDTYTTMAKEGGEFISYFGKLRWEMGIFEKTTFIDRLQQFTKMGEQYGSEFIETYEELFGMMPEGFSEAIETIYSYNEAVEAANEEQRKLQQTMDESTKIIRQNNLAIMRLQLIGMVRRRGLLRSEERAIKELNIRNLKERIKMAEESLDAEEELDKYGLDKKKIAYDKATQFLQEYFDREQFILWQLKDIRDDELDDMDDNIKYKEELLSKYTIWHDEEHQKLELAVNSYIDILNAIDKEGLGEQYKILYGVDIIQEAMDAAEDYFEFISGLSIPRGKTTPGAASLAKILPGARSLPGLSGKVRTALERLGIRSMQRGTYSVPETMPMLVHKYEKIVPPGVSPKDTGGGSIHINNLNIHVRQIADVEDVERIAAVLAVAKQTYILDEQGRTTFRVR